MSLGRLVKRVSSNGLWGEMSGKMNKASMARDDDETDGLEPMGWRWHSGMAGGKQRDGREESAARRRPAGGQPCTLQPWVFTLLGTGRGRQPLWSPSAAP